MSPASWPPKYEKIMTKNYLGIVLFAASITSGCASITGSRNQPLSVQTHQKGVQVVGANCTLQNDKGSWFVTTPGSVVIQKSYSDLAATCNKEGMVPGVATFKSGSNGGVWGNIVAGGLIGYAVDASSGAGFDYPSLLSIEMGVTQAPADKTPGSDGPPRN